MKIWPLCALALFAATLAPATANAQAPAGVARVDSDNYFDTSYSNTDHGGYQDSNGDFADQSDSSWFNFSKNSANHGGLLGKSYVRAAYLYNGVDDEGTINFDAFEGWDTEFSTPIPWISSESLGADFVTEFEHQKLSARVGANSVTSKADFLSVAVRLFAMPSSRVRPYATLGAGFQRFTLDATGVPSSTENDSAFITNIGVEADLAANASIRGDFEIDRDDIDESTFEGTIVLWLGEQVFFRGGTVIPLVDGIDPGVTIGGGLAF